MLSLPVIKKLLPKLKSPFVVAKLASTAAIAISMSEMGPNFEPGLCFTSLPLTENVAVHTTS